MDNRKFGIFAVILVVILLVVAILLPQKKEKEDNFKEELLDIDYGIEGNIAELKYDKENPVVAVYIEKYGSVVMELYPDVAPNTVNNFISLIKAGFYDNNSFHRLVPGFVLQGGDPDGIGSGGPGYSIKGEFTKNGVSNNLSHTKWVVSMARSSDMDSAGSQFFICLADAKNLDGEYASFGKVIDGFDILEKIEKTERVSNTNSGKLQRNLKIKKVLVDLKGKEYPEPEKIKS